LLYGNAKIRKGEYKDEKPENKPEHGSSIQDSSSPECYDLVMTRRASALKHLKRVDPHFYEATKRLHASLPPILKPKRTRAALFKSLVATVISQQLGTAAADTIFDRLMAAVQDDLTPLSILDLRTTHFKKIGLSGAKTKTIREISSRIKNGSLDLLLLSRKSEEEVRATLLTVWGLGPWSADMFLMFALARSDVFSPGDLGLIRAIEALYTLEKNAAREKILAIADTWTPHRTYASLLLWRSRDTKAD
jgi:DNA-3-methyladenine glycosylase II